MDAQLMMSQPTSKLKCRYYRAIYPSNDDIVMVEVKSIQEMGAYVKLLEYKDIEGMILLSELSRRRIRSVNKLVRIGRQEAVAVIRVDSEKGYIDLSKRRASSEEIAKCIEKYNRAKTVFQIIRYTSEQLGYDDEAFEVFMGKTAWHFDTICKLDTASYDKFKKSVQDPSILEECDITEKERETLFVNIKRRMTPQSVKIRADVEVCCYSYKGIDAIKTALMTGLSCSTEDTPIKINLIAPPVYVITTMTVKGEDGVEAVRNAMEAIRESIESFGGLFKVQTEPKIMTDLEEDDLAQRMEKAKLDNMEVAGDSDEESDDGSGESDGAVENGDS